MNDQQRPVDPLFAGLQPTTPPEALRRRVLERATAALHAEPLLDLWSRLWHSTPLRLAWAASVLALIGANLAIPGRSSRPPAPLAAWYPSPLTEADEEVAEIVRLPRLLAEAGSLNAALRQSLSIGDRQVDPRPALPHHTENAS